MVALRNVLEYFFYFRSRLHLHARWGFIPLGGNTVFVRRALLERPAAGTTDCLAEDCDLGVRLSPRGRRVSVAYEPELATREETPATDRRPRPAADALEPGLPAGAAQGRLAPAADPPPARARPFTLAIPFLQAAMFALIPLSLLMVLAVAVPVALALFSFLPLIIVTVSVAVEAAGLAEFARLYGLKARPWHYAVLVVGTLPYQLLLSFSAARAVCGPTGSRTSGRRRPTSVPTAHPPPRRRMTTATSTVDTEIAPFPRAGTASGSGPGRACTATSLLLADATRPRSSACVHVVGMYAAPTLVDDEGTYTAQAWAIEHWHTLAHYTYWYDHPPVGWIQIAGWTWLTDAFDRNGLSAMAGREAMAVAKVVSLGLLFVLAAGSG